MRGARGVGDGVAGARWAWLVDTGRRAAGTGWYVKRMINDLTRLPTWRQRV